MPSVAPTATYLQDTTGQLIAPGIYNIGGVPMMLTLDGVGDAAYQTVVQAPAVGGSAGKDPGDKRTVLDKGLASPGKA